MLGGGLIGSSWATNFLWKGISVHIYDISDEALKTAGNRIRENLEYLVSKGILTADEMNEALGLAKYTMSLAEAVKDVQFLQESVLEKYEVKQALLAEVDKHAPADAVFASSTSGLLITEIAKARSILRDVWAPTLTILLILSRLLRSAEGERRAKRQ